MPTYREMIWMRPDHSGDDAEQARAIVRLARDELIEERLTHSVIGAFYEVYNTLGYGFLEHLCKNALERELRARGHQVGREVYVIVTYKGEELGRQRIDLIVDNTLVVEIKSTQSLHESATRQIHNYLRATNLRVGLLFHFGPKPKLHRIVCRTPGHT